MPPRDFPLLADLVLRGELRLEPMIGRTMPLERINDALALLERGEERRTVIVHGWVTAGTVLDPEPERRDTARPNGR